MPLYEVIVSNIGKVYEGGFYQSALDEFAVYRNRSIKGIDRAAGESVALYRDGEPIREFSGTREEEESTEREEK